MHDFFVAFAAFLKNRYSSEHLCRDAFNTLTSQKVEQENGKSLTKPTVEQFVKLLKKWLSAVGIYNHQLKIHLKAYILTSPEGSISIVISHINISIF